ncbi:MAG: hypothetical protein ACREF0_13015 [Acetobacteraceae bacterium]
MILDRMQLDVPVALPAPIGIGYGLIPEYPKAAIGRLNEEHCMIDLSACRGKPAVGERIRIVPDHVSVVSNLHGEVVTRRGGEVVGTMRGAGRAKTR